MMDFADQDDAKRIVADLRRRSQRRMFGVWYVLAVFVPTNALMNHHGGRWGAAVGDALIALGAVVLVGALLVAVWRFRPAWLDLPAVMGTDLATSRHIGRVLAGTTRARGPVDEALAADSARLAVRINTAITVVPTVVVVIVLIGALATPHRGTGERAAVAVAFILAVLAIQFGVHRRRTRARRFLDQSTSQP